MKKNNFLYFVMASFVFISTSALAIRGGGIKEIFIVSQKPEVKTKIETSKFAPVPTLTDIDTFPIVSAQAVYALDLGSSMSLYEKNSDRPLLPASTTKIMTALVALDVYSPDEIVTIGKLKVDGQKMGLMEGEKISMTDLIESLLIYSANDAAEVLAQHYPTGRADFIKLMNSKAMKLNLTQTRFDNPVGFDSDNNFSTAKDLVRLTEVAMRDPRFSRIVNTKEKIVINGKGVISHKLENTNKLLGKVAGVMGVKTGWTEEARENLVTYIERDGHKVLIALLGSQDRFGETKEIIDWLFTNYKWAPLPSEISSN